MKSNDEITEAELDALINGFENNDFETEKPIDERGDYDSISKTLDEIEKNNPYLEEASHVVEDYCTATDNNVKEKTNRKKLILKDKRNNQMSISNKFKEKLKGRISKDDYIEGMKEAGLERKVGGSSYIEFHDPEGESISHHLESGIDYPMFIDTDKEQMFVNENFKSYKDELISGGLVSSCSFNELKINPNVFKTGLEMERENKIVSQNNVAINVHEKEFSQKLREQFGTPTKEILNNELDSLDFISEESTIKIPKNDINETNKIDKVHHTSSLDEGRNKVLNDIDDDMVSFVADMSKGNDKLRERLSQGENYKSAKPK